jgi:NAD(P)-dependent dehydrogenase (short-subunit alcohol dehydrogenase family)
VSAPSSPGAGDRPAAPSSPGAGDRPAAPSSPGAGDRPAASWSLGAGLEGRGVLVTGAAGGIGRAVAAAFASAGANVVAVDRVPVDAVVAGLGGPGRHSAITADLAVLDRIDALAAEAAAAAGSLDVLAHVAAVIRRRELDDVTAEDWEAQESVNLRAAFFLNRAAARVMRAQGRGGRIVNFTSQGWWTGGFGGSVVYSATKGGVVSMTRGLARTYGPDGILVNCVSPGAVDTPMLRDGMTAEALESFRAQIPLGRFAAPEELAGVVVFLASDHAGYITGATINVSGGQLMY